jgi:unsaturated rhamnogalacturonyl hydrolase
MTALTTAAVFLIGGVAKAQTAATISAASPGNPATIGQPWLTPMAATVITRDGKATTGTHSWDYGFGTELTGMDAAWIGTGNGDYIRYIKQSMDLLVNADGSIPGYKADEMTLDNVQLGRQLLLLYRVYDQPKYYKAAQALRQQLTSQPRNADGGFWHKQRYPNQMWLDGLYMAEPFYAEYASVFHEPQDFDDIAKQFILVEQHTRDAKTGLLYHAWDASPAGTKMAWADAASGHSKIFWSRAMGWYAMALVDTISYFPADDPNRAKLIAILNRLAGAITRVQDPATGLWYQVTDRPTAKSNYLESSASAMFSYALLKGVREGWLPVHYQQNGERAFLGVQKHFVQKGADGLLDFAGTVHSVGLGGTPYRDGSYEYYVGEKQAVNDSKGIGAYLLAASEMQIAPEALLARGKTVMVDGWYNSQKKKDPTGQMVYYHYKWENKDNDGFSMLGHLFHARGMITDSLYAAPTVKNLAKASIYVIASPDIPIKNPNPNYMQPAEADAIAAWVKAGGVLMMMENDVNNADIPHFDLLADKFGLHFNPVDRNQVIGSREEMGELDIPPNAVFRYPHTAFMKDICTIAPSGNAKAVYSEKGDVLIASAKYGKGTVIAIPDPWIYNEYTDGRKPPPPFNNYAAGDDLVQWLVKQIPAPAKQENSKP